MQPIQASPVAEIISCDPIPFDEWMAQPGMSEALPRNHLAALLAQPETSPFWYTEVARCHLLLGEPQKAMRSSLAAIGRAQLTGNIDDMRVGMAVRALAANIVGMFGIAEELIDQLREHEATQDGLVPLANFVYAWHLLNVGSIFDGQYTMAQELFAKSADEFVRRGWFFEAAMSMDGMASAAAGLGHYIESLEHSNKAIAWCWESGMWLWSHRLLLVRASALSDVGYHQEAEVAFEQTVKRCKQIGDQYALGLAYRYLADLVGRRTMKARPNALELGSCYAEQSIRLMTECGAHQATAQTRQQYARVLEAHGCRSEANRQHEMAQKDISTGIPLGVSKTLAIQEVERNALEAERLHRLATQLQAATESSPDAVMVFTPAALVEGGHHDWANEFRNQAAEALIGDLSSDYVMLSSILRLPQMVNMDQLILESLKTNEPREEQVCIDSKWYVRRVVPSEGCFAVGIRDISEIHKTEEALRNALCEAQAADRAKSLFLASISHEVRTPLNGVLGLTSLLAETGIDEVQRGYLDGIISSADLLLGVLDGVLDLARIEAGKFELAPQPTSVRMLVTKLVGIFAGQALRKGLDLRHCVDPEVPRSILVDPVRLRQILSNLVSNAVKYSKVGEVSLTVSVSGNELKFVVADTGPGMDARDLSRIFKPFERGTGIAADPGTGLGLSIAHRCAELMGGRMDVQSRLYEGSEFTLYLPLSAVKPSVKGHAGDEPDISSAKGKRVLVVEDNPVNALVAKGHLVRLGLLVDVVTDGLAAVAVAPMGSYDLILMDVRMPNMNGLEATSRIREAEARSGRRVPIIALTAGALSENRDECFNAGMDGYLIKPFTKEMLIETISTWLCSEA